MKNIRKNIKGKIGFILFILLCSFLSFYFIIETINYQRTEYICKFTYEDEIALNDFVDENQLISIQKSNDKYQNIDVKKLIKKKDLWFVKENQSYLLCTKAKYYDTFFVKSSKQVSSRAKTFLRDYVYSLLEKEMVEFENENIIYSIKTLPSYLISTIGALSIGTIGTTILFLSKRGIEVQEIYDNEKLYLTPFHKKYWIHASKFLSSPKKIATVALLFSMLLISKMLSFPTGFANMTMSLGFIFFSLISMLFGPLAGLCIGFFSDVLGYFLFDTSGSPFFIGYVFQAMLSGFIYGLFLYRTRINFVRIFFARFSISVFCNILLGSFCWGFVANYTWDQTIAYMLVFSLPKNILFLIPQSIILYFIYKILIPVFCRFQLLDERIQKRITIL